MALRCRKHDNREGTATLFALLFVLSTFGGVHIGGESSKDRRAFSFQYSLYSKRLLIEIQAYICFIAPYSGISELLTDSVPEWGDLSFNLYFVPKFVGKLLGK